MRTTITVIQPPPPDNLGIAVREAKIAAAESSPVVTEDLRLAFTRPQAGWMQFLISADSRDIAEWRLSNVLDPFAAKETAPDTHDLSLCFLPWLEGLVDGRDRPLALDMEGPDGVLLCLDDPAPQWVHLIVYESPTGLLLDARIGRRQLVRSVYDQVRAYWQSEDLRLNWQEWSGAREPWEMRSEMIESFTAGADLPGPSS